MTSITTSDDISSWLASRTVDDVRRLLSRHCKVAYRHPYGFDVCRTNLSLFPGWTIRVHLWPRRAELSERMSEANTEDQAVHCHGWNLMTAVVFGAVEEKVFRVEVRREGDWDLFRVTGTRLIGDNSLEL